MWIKSGSPRHPLRCFYLRRLSPLASRSTVPESSISYNPIGATGLAETAMARNALRFALVAGIVDMKKLPITFRLFKKSVDS
jgi:hypothetical protein